MNFPSFCEYLTFRPQLSWDLRNSTMYACVKTPVYKQLFHIYWTASNEILHGPFSCAYAGMKVVGV